MKAFRGSVWIANFSFFSFFFYFSSFWRTSKIFIHHTDHHRMNKNKNFGFMFVNIWNSVVWLFCGLKELSVFKRIFRIVELFKTLLYIRWLLWIWRLIRWISIENMEVFWYRFIVVAEFCCFFFSLLFCYFRYDSLRLEHEPYIRTTAI